MQIHSKFEYLHYNNWYKINNVNIKDCKSDNHSHRNNLFLKSLSKHLKIPGLINPGDI